MVRNKDRGVVQHPFTEEIHANSSNESNTISVSAFEHPSEVSIDQILQINDLLMHFVEFLLQFLGAGGVSVHMILVLARVHQSLWFLDFIANFVRNF